MHKKTKNKMNKKTFVLIIIAIIAVVGIVVSMIALNQKRKMDDLANRDNSSYVDSQRFSEEYTSVPEDNVFVYRNADEIIRIMQNGTGVVYLGFPGCPWCQAYLKYLNEIAKETGIETIYYFNISEDRKNNTEQYQEMVALLGDSLQYDDEGNHRIYVPNISFHINGELIGNDYESSKDTLGYNLPSDYWTDKRVNDLKTRLKKYMQKIVDHNSECEETCDV